MILALAGEEIGDIFLFASKDIDKLEDIGADDKGVLGAGDQRAGDAGRLRDDLESAAELAERQAVELVHRLRLSIEAQLDKSLAQLFSLDRLAVKKHVSPSSSGLSLGG